MFCEHSLDLRHDKFCLSNKNDSVSKVIDLLRVCQICTLALARKNGETLIETITNPGIAGNLAVFCENDPLKDTKNDAY
jgi:hypothetical protein